MADMGNVMLTTTFLKEVFATVKKKHGLPKLTQHLKNAQRADEIQEIVRTAITAHIAEKVAAAAVAAEDDMNAANAAATALGELILKMNPYTNSQVKDRNNSTGEMLISDDPVVETEGPYAQEWTFKGHPQRVGMAARIKYRCPVRNEGSETLFWVEDYLLIGFQGSMGG